MLTYVQAIMLGGIQGITELFPISSLGHSVIIPALLHWNLDRNSNIFLVFVIATHFATALVLFFFFFSDWVLILKGILRSFTNREIRTDDTYAKIGWLIIVASIPAGIIGILFEKKLTILFASPLIISLFLILNGFVLYGVEVVRKRKERNIVTLTPDQTIAHMTFYQTVKIGCAQCLALLAGFSRTGSALAGGLLTGLDHESSARFSFLLATPIIFAAAILKIPDIFTPQSSVSLLGPVIAGFCASGIAAFFSVVFLTTYFKTKKLTPFAVYCILAGVLSFVFLFFK